MSDLKEAQSAMLRLHAEHRRRHAEALAAHIDLFLRKVPFRITDRVTEKIRELAEELCRGRD